MGPKKPAFQQRSYPVDTRHELVRRFVTLADNSDFVRVAFFLDSSVARPSVRMNHRARVDGLLNKRVHTLRRQVENSTEPNPADSSTIFFCCYHYDRLVFRFPAADTFFLTAHVGLIHLDATPQAVPPRLDHRPSKFVEPSPGCLIAAEAQDTL